MKLSYSAIAAALAAVLSGCSSSSGGTMPIGPTPAPTSTPTEVCHGAVSDDRGHTVPIAVRMALDAPSDDIAPAPSGGGKLAVTPSSVSLTPAHPTAEIVIREQGYSGPFVAAVNGCSRPPTMRFVSGDHGPRATLELRLP